ncbi:DNA alkylation repair protein [Kocuria kalidii]|uniref:DNA alkylation repair protein n=1 Tax=Kocuria kalidii TaxID=3376283 RepID=UPI0037A84867
MGDVNAPLVTAADVERALMDAADPAEIGKIRKRVREDEPVFGVRMGALFEIAKTAADAAPGELDTLFEHAAYEPRMTAFCILDFRARRRLSDEERAVYGSTYLGRHDAITAWDMVDRAAPRVLGWPLMIGVLGDPRLLLEDLARSADPLRRRSAITAPLWFIKQGSAADIELGTHIATMLDDDPEPLVRSAVKTYRKHTVSSAR